MNFAITPKTQTFQRKSSNKAIGRNQKGLRKYHLIESERMKKRIGITKEVLNAHIDIQEIASEGDSKLERCLSLVHMGDYISYYTALGRNVDPMPVAIIEEFKRKMAQ